MKEVLDRRHATEYSEGAGDLNHFPLQSTARQVIKPGLPFLLFLISEHHDSLLPATYFLKVKKKKIFDGEYVFVSNPVNSWEITIVNLNGGICQNYLQECCKGAGKSTRSYK